MILSYELEQFFSFINRKALLIDFQTEDIELFYKDIVFWVFEYIYENVKINQNQDLYQDLFFIKTFFLFSDENIEMVEKMFSEISNFYNNINFNYDSSENYFLFHSFLKDKSHLNELSLKKFKEIKNISDDFKLFWDENTQIPQNLNNFLILNNLAKNLISKKGKKNLFTINKPSKDLNKFEKEKEDLSNKAVALKGLKNLQQNVVEGVFLIFIGKFYF